MPDQVLAEVLKQGILGALLIVVVWYFMRELKGARTERDFCQAELRKLETSMRESVVPVMTRMIDVTQVSQQALIDVRADLKAERNRGTA